MAKAEYPSRYVALHLLIDRHLDGARDNRYSVRILPPAPVVDSFRDDPYPLKPKSLPHGFVGLADSIGAALSSRQTPVETDRVFTQILECGQWIDGLLNSVHMDLRHCLHDSLNLYQALDRNVGLLVRLHFGQRASDLSSLIWESWHTEDGGGHPFLIRRPGLSLVRFVPSHGSPRVGPGGTDGRLQVVVVTSSFDERLERDGALTSYMEQEWQSVETALASLRRNQIVDIRRLVDPTVAELQRALRDADIYHHFGHGGLDDQTRAPFVMLKDPRGDRGKRIHWFEFRSCVEQADRLRLVVLNACSLQRAGLGTQLARLGIPAVIVMQADVQARVIAERGFTEEFYASLAAGEPVHVAFSRARAGIWARDNCVEPFVPVLILSTLDELAFRRARPSETGAALRGWLSSAPDGEDLRQLWETACEQEGQGALGTALIRFDALLRRQPDYPGVRDKIVAIKRRLEVQKQWREVIDRLRRSLKKGDDAACLAALRQAKELAPEAEVAGDLESIAFELKDRVSRLMNAAEWGKARQAFHAAEVAVELVPVGRRPALPPAAALDAGVSGSMAEVMARLEALHQSKQWVELKDAAEEFLRANPGHARATSLMAEVSGILDSISRIRVEEVSKARPPSEMNRVFQQLKELGNWRRIRQTARSVLRSTPKDAGALEMLSEALDHEVEDLIAAERWNDAAKRCQEWLDVEPDSARARGSLIRVLVEQAQDAIGRLEWDKARDFCGRVLALSPRHAEARKLLARVEDNAALLRRIGRRP